jgi:hypothetical protein
MVMSSSSILRSPTASPDSRIELADVQVDEVITCIDCGGRAHLLSYPPEDGEWSPGDVVTYRCADCLDRWDLVVPDDTAE